MSKCKPGATEKFLALEQFGVSLTDVTEVGVSAKAEPPERTVVISIPYVALRDSKEVQLAFQDLVRISTTE